MTFRWPWVARERLDQMQRWLELARAETRRERDIADVRYDELLQKYIEAVTPKAPPTPMPGQQVPRPVNKIAAKIREEAGGDNTLIAHWNKMAAQMKKDGKTEDEILAAIGWVDANPPTDQAA